MKRLWCWIVGHRWRLTTSAPRGVARFHDIDALQRWIEADYDYYSICVRCGACEGIGDRY